SDEHSENKESSGLQISGGDERQKGEESADACLPTDANPEVRDADSADAKETCAVRVIGNEALTETRAESEKPDGEELSGDVCQGLSAASDSRREEKDVKETTHTSLEKEQEI
ncbi:hypothetical protein M569_10489, partial [Genlisea aurea]